MTMNEDTRLSTKEYWDTYYNPDDFSKERISFIDTILQKKIFSWLVPYDEYLLWDVLLEEYLPKNNRLRVLEVGSAPGKFLLRLHRVFNFVPYGVDFSEKGVAVNKKIFEENNINSNNIICADFLSEDFHNKHKDSFDIVVSRGFIEHFADVRDVVEKHMNVLKSGGYLVINIPNLTGLNYSLANMFNKEGLETHNCDIMNLEAFTGLFDEETLQKLYCRYYGTFSFYLFNTKHFFACFILRLCRLLQLIVLNPLFRMLFGKKGKETAGFSPYLLFIGKKR